MFTKLHQLKITKSLWQLLLQSYKVIVGFGICLFLLNISLSTMVKAATDCNLPANKNSAECTAASQTPTATDSKSTNKATPKNPYDGVATINSGIPSTECTGLKKKITLSNLLVLTSFWPIVPTNCAFVDYTAPTSDGGGKSIKAIRAWSPVMIVDILIRLIGAAFSLAFYCGVILVIIIGLWTMIDGFNGGDGSQIWIKIRRLVVGVFAIMMTYVIVFGIMSLLPSGMTASTDISSFFSLSTP